MVYKNKIKQIINIMNISHQIDVANVGFFYYICNIKTTNIVKML